MPYSEQKFDRKFNQSGKLKKSIAELNFKEDLEQTILSNQDSDDKCICRICFSEETSEENPLIGPC